MKRFTTSLVIVLFVCSNSFAQVIDFEDIAVAPGGNDIAGDRISGGFSFDSVTDHTHLQNNSFTPDNGSTHLVIDDFQGVNVVVMSQLNGNDFDLATIDLSQSDPLDNRATDVMFTGFYSAGGVIQQSFDIAAANNSWATYNFVGNWTGLTFVEIQGSGSTASSANYYAIDNISLVPEPTSGALVMVGLASLVAWRRRRQSAI